MATIGAISLSALNAITEFLPKSPLNRWVSPNPSVENDTALLFITSFADFARDTTPRPSESIPFFII